MFSGIIQSVAAVKESTDDTLSVASDIFTADEDEVRLGDSIAVNGTCLTVAALEQGVARFDLASETRRRTALGQLAAGSKVNLERSLRVGDRIDGHFVLGHVDGVAEVRVRESQENTVRFVFSLPSGLRPFVAPKGSISIDGVSLTVGECGEDDFSVYIVPHTLSHTIMDEYESGTRVNLEIDCLARYVVQHARSHLS